jgi:hypothetical protein
MEERADAQTYGSTPRTAVSKAPVRTFKQGKGLFQIKALKTFTTTCSLKQCKELKRARVHLKLYQ